MSARGSFPLDPWVATDHTSWVLEVRDFMPGNPLSQIGLLVVPAAGRSVSPGAQSPQPGFGEGLMAHGSARGSAHGSSCGSAHGSARGSAHRPIASRPVGPAPPWHRSFHLPTSVVSASPILNFVPLETRTVALVTMVHVREVSKNGDISFSTVSDFMDVLQRYRRV